MRVVQEGTTSRSIGGVGLRGQKAQLAGCRRGGQLEIWSNWKNPKLENQKKHLRRKGWRDAEKKI